MNNLGKRKVRHPRILFFTVVGSYCVLVNDDLSFLGYSFLPISLTFLFYAQFLPMPIALTVMLKKTAMRV